MRIRSYSSSLTQQKGFLAALAVLLILIVAFLGTVMAYLYVGSSNATINTQMSENALFMAESGLEKGTRFISTPLLTGTNARTSCAGVAGKADLTNSSFGTGPNAGTFTVTTANSSPIYARTTLNGALTSTASTIAVASTSGFAPAGRIIVDKEIINYGGVSGNSFIGVQRGVNYNYNTAHATGAAVAQYQCDLDSDGGIPNLNSPLYSRDLVQGVMLQEGWAVGAVLSSTFTFTRWNRPTELTWNNSALSNASATTLNGISMLSYADGWAVGNPAGTRFTFLRWNGTSWTRINPAASCSNQILNGVSAVSSQEAWAVGDSYRTGGSCTNTGGTRVLTVLRWNGTAWTALTSATTPAIPANASTNQNLNAVHVIATNGNSTGNLGFAVGDAGYILQYNGTAWTRYTATTPTTQNLLGVYVVSASEAWAVGAAGVILKWNGSTWSAVTSPTTTQLNSIAMLDATLAGTAQSGWAVGNSGVAVYYNGSSWVSNNTGNANNMNAVAILSSSSDVWAVGATGIAMHWDGSAWTSITSNVGVALNGIAFVAPQPYPFAWRETYA